MIVKKFEHISNFYILTILTNMPRPKLYTITFVEYYSNKKTKYSGKSLEELLNTLETELNLNIEDIYEFQPYIETLEEFKNKNLMAKLEPLRANKYIAINPYKLEIGETRELLYGKTLEELLENFREASMSI